MIFGLPRRNQKCTKFYECVLTFRSGKPCGGHLRCFTAFFAILLSFWAHSGLLLGQFLANLGCFYCFLEVVGLLVYLIASRIPPGRIKWLLGWLVVFLLSCCPAVLLRCFLVGLLWFCLTMPLCCCLVLFLLSCCVAAVYTLKGDRDREGGWNTGLTIIPPSHQLTTPRLPTTLIHPTHHKYQETLKKKQAKMKR